MNKLAPLRSELMCKYNFFKENDLKNNIVLLNKIYEFLNSKI